MKRTFLANNLYAGQRPKPPHWFLHRKPYNMNSMLYVDKGGYSLNGKIVPAELLPLMQNTLYHLTNPQNRITTKVFDMVRIMTSKQEKFCRSDSALIRHISNKLQSDPVLVQPKLASVLIQSVPVLICAHLWQLYNSGLETLISLSPESILFCKFYIQIRSASGSNETQVIRILLDSSFNINNQ